MSFCCHYSSSNEQQTNTDTFYGRLICTTVLNKENIIVYLPTKYLEVKFLFIYFLIYLVSKL